MKPITIVILSTFCIMSNNNKLMLFDIKYILYSNSKKVSCNHYITAIPNLLLLVIEAVMQKNSQRIFCSLNPELVHFVAMSISSHLYLQSSRVEHGEVGYKTSLSPSHAFSHIEVTNKLS